MTDSTIDVIRNFLAETGGKLTLECQNRVTLTRPPQAAKSTKDVETAAVVGVEVSAYGATASDAAQAALEAFQSTIKKIDG